MKIDRVVCLSRIIREQKCRKRDSLGYFSSFFTLKARYLRHIQPFKTFVHRTSVPGDDKGDNNWHIILFFRLFTVKKKEHRKLGYESLLRQLTEFYLAMTMRQ